MKTIVNKQARIISTRWHKSPSRPAGRIDLKPGTNSVPDEVYHAASQLDVFRMWKRIGWIVVKGERKVPAAQKAPEPQSLRELTAEQAIAHVKTVDDVDKLESWLGTEERKTVVKALTDRIDHLLGGSDEGGEGEDDEGGEGEDDEGGEGDE